MEVVLFVDEVKRKVDARPAGFEHFKLGDLVSAYISDKGLDRVQASKQLVEDLRRELEQAHCRVWPAELPDQRATRNVFVISLHGLLGAAVWMLEQEPSPALSTLLNNMLAKGAGPEPA